MVIITDLAHQEDKILMLTTHPKDKTDLQVTVLII